MKKILSVAVAVTLLLSIASSAMAAEGSITQPGAEINQREAVLPINVISKVVLNTKL